MLRTNGEFRRIPMNLSLNWIRQNLVQTVKERQVAPDHHQEGFAFFSTRSIAGVRYRKPALEL